MKSKKGVELTLNTVIIAALGVIVLLVVVFMFLHGVREGNITFFGCDSKDGECMTKEECSESGGKIFPGSSCGEDRVCCILQDDS